MPYYKEDRKDCLYKGDIMNDFKVFWNRHPSLPTIRAITTKRKAKLDIRLKEQEFRGNWRVIIEKAAASDFLTQTWKGCNIDWVLVNDTNYIKILEGKYDNKVKKEPSAIVQKERLWFSQCGMALNGFMSPELEVYIKPRLSDPEFRAWAERINEKVKDIK